VAWFTCFGSIPVLRCWSFGGSIVLAFSYIATTQGNCWVEERIEYKKYGLKLFISGGFSRFNYLLMLSPKLLWSVIYGI
jgi:hypothetical protein